MKRLPLGQVATISRSAVDPRKVDPATRYIGLEHIERGGRILGDETLGSAGIKSTKFRFSPEHLLYGKLRPNLGKIARPNESGVCSTDILPVLPGPELDRDFLFHYLNQPDIVAFAASRATGANLPRLSPKALENFVIPLPPLDEQRRIATILDQADALRAKRRQTLVEFDRLVSSIYYDMFNDDRSNSFGFPKTTIGEVAKIIVPTRDKPLEFGGAVPWVTLPDLEGLEISRSQLQVDIDGVRVRSNRLIPPDSVLLSCAGSLGRVAVNRVPVFVNQQFYGIVPADRASTLYIAVSLQAKHPSFFASLAGTSTISYFSSAKAAEIDLLWPPIELQTEFSARIESVLRAKVRAEESLSLLHYHFQSVCSSAFSGRLCAAGH
ncbi:restriction endonuclease subunit S [Mycobacterium sp. GA-1285]|uniref:restriction endonuclease subunit S n=1 Tax=Mycobacterium sp. GA-1285 TaxID=1772282 RepID=UPI0009E8362A|nr:restriction endonuclease subunit S [Mycobacterium sp. GA-1285]